MIFIHVLSMIIFSLIAGQNLDAMFFRNAMHSPGLAMQSRAYQKPGTHKSSSSNSNKWRIAAGGTAALVSTMYCLKHDADTEQRESLALIQKIPRANLLDALDNRHIGTVMSLLSNQQNGFEFEHAFVDGYENHDQEIIIRIMINHPDFTDQIHQKGPFVRWALATVASKGYQDCLHTMLTNEAVLGLIDNQTAVTIFVCSIMSNNPHTVNTVLTSEAIRKHLTHQDLEMGMKLSLTPAIDHEIRWCIQQVYHAG